MPSNSGKAFVIGGLVFVLGFALVWHIWWLAVLVTLAVLFTIIARSMEDEVETVIPAAEIERIEQARLQQLSAVIGGEGHG